MPTPQKPKPYTPATTLRELDRNFRLKTLDIKEHADFIVDDLHQESLKDLEQRFIDHGGDDDSLTLFLSGYIGSGKSTFLKQFSELDAINERFKPLIIDFNNYFEPHDKTVTVIDILLAVIDCVPDGLWDKKKYEKKLDALILKDTTEVERSSGILAGIDVKLGCIADFKINVEKKKIIRGKLENQKNELTHLVNQIFGEIKDKQGTSHLMILDELEKSLHIVALTRIMGEELSTLEQLAFQKIIVIPPEIFILSGIAPVMSSRIRNVVTLETKLYKNTVSPSPDEDKIIEKNKNYYRQLVEKRLSKDADLIEDKNAVLTRAIEYSGGLLTQFANLIAESAFYARLSDSPKMRMEHLEKAIYENSAIRMRQIFSKPSEMEVIHAVQSNKNSRINTTKELSDALAWCIRSGMIIMFNSNSPSYRVNPLIDEQVKKYK